MHVSCKCLNVSIKSRGNELQKINIDDLELTAHERTDNFFRETLGTVSELEGISKEQPGLVEVKNVGSWIIHRCCNCLVYTHAVHREHGAALVIINVNIVTSEEEIEKLKSNIDYSPVFRIIINHSTFDDLDYLQPTKFSVSQVPNNVQVALGGLQQQLEEAVQRRAAEVEEKIRTFTTEQYQLLEQFRARAHNDHRFLTRLIYNGDEAHRFVNNIEIQQVIPDGFKQNLTTSETNTVNAALQIVSNDTTGTITHNNKRDAAATCSPTLHINGNIEKRDIYKKETNSFDTEALFPLEGMEDILITDHLRSLEDSDTDDSEQDESIHIHRVQRGGHPTLAKSLPVSVPSFPSFVRQTIQDQDDDQLSRDPLDPHNIRASIKALAKSVHGDTVFGDLPRPRFSTQI